MIVKDDLETSLEGIFLRCTILSPLGGGGVGIRTKGLCFVPGKTTLIKVTNKEEIVIEGHVA